MTTRTDSRRRESGGNLLWMASFALAGLVAVAFGAMATQRAADAGAGASVWEGVAVDGIELESHASLSELALSADAGVRGRVVAVEPSRLFGDPGGARLHYAAATLLVEEVLVGGLRSEDATRLTLEIPLFDGPGQITALQEGLPWAESIYFLRHKAESARAAGLSGEAQLADAGFYRLVTMRAVLVNEGGHVVVMTDAPGFLAELEGRRFDQVTDAVRDARQ